MKHRFLALALAGVLALSAAGCAAQKPGGSADPGPIKVATKPMTEQRVLGQMLKELIEAKTDYTVEVTEGIAGGTANIHPAMEKGEFDLYPEYTSSGWVVVLGHKAGEVADEDMLAALQKEYQEKFGMTWLGLYGFNNTYTVAVRNEIVEQYGLQTCSDLAAVSDQLVFGGNPDYLERDDGYKAMAEAYGFQFKDVKDIDIGLKYEAMAAGEIDATNAYTTDAQLSAADVTAMADDLGFQVNYFCSTVVRQDALEKYAGLEEVLMLMDGLITDADMSRMNYAAEVEGQEPADVAHAYLVDKGLVEG